MIPESMVVSLTTSFSPELSSRNKQQILEEFGSYISRTAATKKMTLNVERAKVRVTPKFKGEEIGGVKQMQVLRIDPSVTSSPIELSMLTEFKPINPSDLDWSECVDEQEQPSKTAKRGADKLAELRKKIKEEE